MDAKDEIKARLPIEQLVGQYCQLQRKGRNFVCVCPFHNDSHPSFLVSPDKGIGYCFACNTGGDIFNFYMRIESVDFPTALRQLAEKAGVILPERSKTISKEEFHEKQDMKERVRLCLDEAAAFYEAQLKTTPKATEYLTGRGVTGELLALFRIGYAPDSFSATYDHLLKAGFSRSEIVAAGLGVQKELTDERIYDRFRDRIMFPIMNVQGQIIAFGGRTMGNDDAKYINSPENPLYHKSSILFGLFQARDVIRIDRRVLLVEGYFDVVAAHKAGVKNAVAVCGTALTEDHAKLLKRYADTVVLCLDQDKAGRLAAERAFQLLGRQQLVVESISIPTKDPDEMVQKDAAEFKAIATSRSKPYIDSVFEELSTHPRIREPEGKRLMAERIFPLFDALATSVELRAYIEKACRLFQTMESELSADFNRWRNASRVPSRAREQEPIEKAPFTRYELCLGIGMVYSAHRPLLQELIPAESEVWEQLRLSIISAEKDLSVKDIVDSLVTTNDAFRQQAHVLALYCEENFAHWSDVLAGRELKKLCMGANKDSILRRQTSLIEQLKVARQAGQIDDETRLLNQYQQVLKLAKMASV